MKFKKGQSGNPAGRPKGVANPQAKLRQAIADDLPEVLAVLVEKAKSGDVGAASLLLSRCLPPLRPEAQTVTLPDGAPTLSGRAEAIASAVLAGDLPTSTAADLMSVLQGQARVKEIDDIEQRLRAIEERLT